MITSYLKRRETKYPRNPPLRREPVGWFSSRRLSSSCNQALNTAIITHCPARALERGREEREREKRREGSTRETRIMWDNYDMLCHSDGAEVHVSLESSPHCTSHGVAGKRGELCDYWVCAFSIHNECLSGEVIQPGSLVKLLSCRPLSPLAMHKYIHSSSSIFFYLAALW